MKFRVRGICVLGVLLVIAFSACSVQPAADDKKSSGSSPSVSIISSSPSTIPDYAFGDGTSVNFSATAKNTGIDLPSGSFLFVKIIVSPTSGLSLSQLLNSSGAEMIAGTSAATCPSENTVSLNETHNVSEHGSVGANYFYAVSLIIDASSTLVCGDIKQLNTIPVTKGPAPYAAWPTTSQAGESSAGAASLIISGKWYSSALSSYTPTMYYKMNVTSGTTYKLFLDNAFRCSYTYTGNTCMIVYDNDGTTIIGGGTCSSRYYNTPLSVTASGTTMYIQLVPYNNYKLYGSFAFGVQ